jgi:hypothetical protein
MKVHDLATCEFGIEIRAFRRQQEAVARVMLDIVDGKRFYEEGHLREAGSDGFAGASNGAHRLHVGVVEEKAVQDGDVPLSRAARQLDTHHFGSWLQQSETDATVRGSRPERIQVCNRVRDGQVKSLIPKHQPMGCQSLKGRSTNLDCCEGPAGGQAMMTIGEEEFIAFECGLQPLDFGGVFDAPYLVKTAKTVARFDERVFVRRHEGSKSVSAVVAPEEEAAGLKTCLPEFASARRHSIRKRLFVREDCGDSAIKKSDDTVANRLSLAARKNETLPVKEQCGLSVPHQIGGINPRSGFFAGYEDKIGASRIAHGAKGQQNWHSSGELRIAREGIV